MTTDSRRYGQLARTGQAAAVALALGGAACAGGLENRHGNTLDVSAYPKEVQEAYPVFARRCSRCHTLARPLNARIDDPEHWQRYVYRMRMQPGSGINRANGEIILRFLTYYATHVRGDGAANDYEVEPAAAGDNAPSNTTPETGSDTEMSPAATDSMKGSAP